MVIIKLINILNKKLIKKQFIRLSGMIAIGIFILNMDKFHFIEYIVLWVVLWKYYDLNTYYD